jgi:hypothetical protein
MSNRKTTKWTNTLEECFPKTGAVGTEGELLAKEILEGLGYKVKHEPSNRELQCSGIDLMINNEYGIDVKANLHTDGDVIVEKSKLMKSSARFWMHVNREDPTDYIIYPVAWMRRKIQLTSPNSHGCVYVKRETIPPHNP